MGCMWQEIPEHKEDIVILLEAWKNFERICISEPPDKKAQREEAVQKKIPRRIKRRRSLYTDDGRIAGVEEVWDYVFPEEEGAALGLKLLEAAYEWEKTKTPVAV